MPTIASPSHSWSTSPVKETVCNAQTETNSDTSSQKVVFKRHCAGFAASRACTTFGVLILITSLRCWSLRLHRDKKSSPTCNQMVAERDGFMPQIDTGGG